MVSELNTSGEEITELNNQKKMNNGLEIVIIFLKLELLYTFLKKAVIKINSTGTKRRLNTCPQ